jgi:hypothetical protein
MSLYAASFTILGTIALNLLEHRLIYGIKIMYIARLSVSTLDYLRRYNTLVGLCTKQNSSILRS